MNKNDEAKMILKSLVNEKNKNDCAVSKRTLECENIRYKAESWSLGSSSIHAYNSGKQEIGSITFDYRSRLGSRAGGCLYISRLINISKEKAYFGEMETEYNCVGSNLTKFAFDYCSKLANCDGISLDSVPDARDFYKKLGFEEDYQHRRFKDDYTIPFYLPLEKKSSLNAAITKCTSRCSVRLFGKSTFSDKIKEDKEYIRKPTL